MNYNWDIIGDKIFGILRGRGYRLQMFDKSGNKTMDPHEATRFFATVPSQDPSLENFNILLSLHNEDSSSHMDIKTPTLQNDGDFNTVINLKKSLENNVGDAEGLSINWYKFDHDIDPREDAVNNIQESKDISKPYGSTKSSYQQIGNSKLIIRHTDPVDESKQGSRWRRIRNIFIETKLGERFAYPHPHIAGARAMARHLANEGRMNDSIGDAIIRMSEDYINLKRASKMLRHAGDDRSLTLRDAIRKLSKDSKRLSGNRGYDKGITDLNLLSEVDQQAYIDLANDLIENCGCSHDDEDAVGALNTAARYIIMTPVGTVTDSMDINIDDDDFADDDMDVIRLSELAGLTSQDF